MSDQGPHPLDWCSFTFREKSLTLFTREIFRVREIYVSNTGFNSREVEENPEIGLAAKICYYETIAVRFAAARTVFCGWTLVH